MLPPTTDTSLSDWPPTTASSLSPPSPQLFLDHTKSVESLRSFVKKEIGLNAIDNRLSLPVIEDARSSSWSTIDSDSFNPVSWTEERVNRGGQSSRECNVPSADEVAQSEEQKTPIENLSKFKGKLQTSPRYFRSPDQIPEKYLSRCNSFKVRTKAGAKAVVSKVRKCFCELVGRT